jgi:uncharacterized protein YjlB
LAGLLALGLFAGCQNETQKEAPKTAEKQATEKTAAETAPAPKGWNGTVTETMNSGGYTYVQVDTGKEKIWAAAPEFQVKVGDSVVVPAGMAMNNYHSKTLDRDFDVVYFVDSVMVGGAEDMQAGAKMPEGHPEVNDRVKAEPTDVDLSDIEKPEGGQTVADVFTNKKELVGKEVKIRAKVVKFSPEIMGKNWIHLQDGTGKDGSNDLTVTTDAVAKVGDTVLVTGKVTADKDFGYGYKYDVILEDAKVTVE